MIELVVTLLCSAVGTYFFITGRKRQREDMARRIAEQMLKNGEGFDEHGWR